MTGKTEKRGVFTHGFGGEDWPLRHLLHEEGVVFL